MIYFMDWIIRLFLHRGTNWFGRNVLTPFLKWEGER